MSSHLHEDYRCWGHQATERTCRKFARSKGGRLSNLPAKAMVQYNFVAYNKFSIYDNHKKNLVFFVKLVKNLGGQKNG